MSGETGMKPAAGMHRRPSGCVLGCEIVLELHRRFSCISRSELSEIAEDYPAFVRRSLCVLGGGMLQGFAISSGQLST
jgi:hypothetical protein